MPAPSVSVSCPWGGGGKNKGFRACLCPVFVVSVRSRSGDAVGSQRRPRRLAMVPSVRSATVIAGLPRARRPRPPSRCRAVERKKTRVSAPACPVSVASVRSRSGDAAGSQCRPRPSAAGLVGLVRGDLVEPPHARCPRPPSPCRARGGGGGKTRVSAPACLVSVALVRSRSGDAAGSQCRPRPSAAGLVCLVRGDLVEPPLARCSHPPSPCCARVSAPCLPRACPVPAPCPPPPSGPALTNPPVTRQVMPTAV